MDILFKNAKVYIEKESFANELLVTDGRIAKIDPKEYPEDVTESAAESIKETGFGCITGNKWFQNGPLKLFADGSLGARTAHMRNGYADAPDNKGIQTITEKDLEEHCRYAEKAGLQVVTHGIGDGP